MTQADLISRYDGRVPRYTSYPTAPHFSPAVDGRRYADWLAELPPGMGLSLYLHVPFCDRLCLYCGCNTTVVRREAPRRAYAAQLLRELRAVAAGIGHLAPVTHVHWGGGTPTTLPGDCLTEIMNEIRTLFDVQPEAEIAIEIDPTSLPADRLAALTPMGVNRVSLGVQDFDPAVQAAIGRVQSFEATQDCAVSLRGLGITSLNLDLIYGLPHQTEESVTRTARQALTLGADRVAVFGYAHVPWMKRHQALIPEASLPGADARFVQRAAIGQVLESEGGFLPVGLDHYAMPNDAMATAAGDGSLRRGFQGYTTDTATALIGIGASAIGSLPQGYVQNATAVPAYAASIEGGQLAVARGIEVTADDRLRRAVIERLMCDLRVDLTAVAAAHRLSADALLQDAKALGRFEADGLVQCNGADITVTEAGRPFVRNVAAVFDAYLTTASATPRHSRAV
jgi:oxygen-independent coproporphyrinogen-3 oxidase